ncbi:MAG: protein kinase, partial [Acidobacteria bacterium]|nr:protein kinase [Acidobacteriota bacterium]
MPLDRSDAEAASVGAGAVLADRFVLRRRLGHGAVGEVWEAEDRELRERVAVKLLRPQVARDSAAIARFKREIQLARRVTHPNVCRIYDLVRHE